MGRFVFTVIAVSGGCHIEFAPRPRRGVEPRYSDGVTLLAVRANPWLLAHARHL